MRKQLPELVDPDNTAGCMDRSTLNSLVQAHNSIVELRDCADSLMIHTNCQKKTEHTRISCVLPYLSLWNMRVLLVDENPAFFSRDRIFRFSRQLPYPKLIERILTSRAGKKTIILAYDSQLDYSVISGVEPSDFRRGDAVSLNIASNSFLESGFMADFMNSHRGFHPFSLEKERRLRYDRFLTILVLEIKLIYLVIGTLKCIFQTS
jgi:hypothetical protein